MLIPRYTMPDPQILGAEHQLGKHKTTYKSLQIYGCYFAIGVMLFGLAMVYLPQIDFSQFAIGSLIGVLISGGIVVTILLRIIPAYQNGLPHAFVYDYGLLIYARRVWYTAGGNPYRRDNETESLQIIYWKDVKTVLRTMSRYSDNADGYAISCTDRTYLLHYAFYNMRQLGELIERETARFLFPVALQTYQMSHAVVFGPLSVTPQGLRVSRSSRSEPYYEEDLLPWSEMKGIQTNGGRMSPREWIVIRKRGKRSPWKVVHGVELHYVPNVEVFRMLVEHVRKVQGLIP